MVKKILIVLFFAIMLLGVVVFQMGLKTTPQFILIGLGLCTSAAIWFKVKSLQHFLLNLLIFIGSYTALFMISTAVLDIFQPDRALVVVDGKSYPVMDWSWVNSMIIGVVGSVIVTLLYHYKLKKVWEEVELYYALGFGVLTTIFLIVG
jgi:hypothetical protein